MTPPAKCTFSRSLEIFFPRQYRQKFLEATKNSFREQNKKPKNEITHPSDQYTPDDNNTDQPQHSILDTIHKTSWSRQALHLPPLQRPQRPAVNRTRNERERRMTMPMATLWPPPCSNRTTIEHPTRTNHPCPNHISHVHLHHQHLPHLRQLQPVQRQQQALQTITTKNYPHQHRHHHPAHQKSRLINRSAMRSSKETFKIC